MKAVGDNPVPLPLTPAHISCNIYLAGPARTQSLCSFWCQCCLQHRSARGSGTGVRKWSRCPQMKMFSSSHSLSLQLWAASLPRRGRNRQSPHQWTWPTSTVNHKKNGQWRGPPVCKSSNVRRWRTNKCWILVSSNWYHSSKVIWFISPVVHYRLIICCSFIKGTSACLFMLWQ